jgi:hypothetical protein
MKLSEENINKVPQDIGVSKRKLKIIQKSTSNKSKN